MQIVNKKAKFNYNLYEKIEAGIVLSGGEVKAIRHGKADLSNTYAKIMNSEVFLINANIPVPGKKDYSPTRTRKLLLHKGEIISLMSKSKAQNLTLVPTKIYAKGPLIKVELALAKSKLKFEKRKTLKERDIERAIQQELRGKDS